MLRQLHQASGVLAGVSGVDDSAVRLRLETERARIDVSALIEDASRPTTTKTRVTAGGQQIVRFDEEDRSPLPDKIESALRERCISELERADACILSDYAKGVLGEGICRPIIDQAARLGKPLVVDPKSHDLGRYRGATVVTPNLKEAGGAAAIPLESSGDLNNAVQVLLQRIAPSSLLVTRGENGMSLFEPKCDARHLPALRNEVADVTGAGDTVVAALALALATGFDLFDAACIANIAAAVAVSHHGTWAVTRAELAHASTQLDLSALPAGA